MGLGDLESGGGSLIYMERFDIWFLWDVCIHLEFQILH